MYYQQFICPVICPDDRNVSLIIEDNEEVAYAYLLHDSKIISDLWLYNSSPVKYDSWDDINEDDLPVQNILKYMISNVKPINEDAEVMLKWEIKNDVTVHMYIRDEYIGYLTSKEKVGYSTLVNQNTPIANMIK